LICTDRDYAGPKEFRFFLLFAELAVQGLITFTLLWIFFFNLVTTGFALKVRHGNQPQLFDRGRFYLPLSLDPIFSDEFFLAGGRYRFYGSPSFSSERHLLMGFP